MKFTYDPEADALSIFWGQTPVDVSDEIAPGVILDYDAAGVVLGVEILNASQKIQYLTPEEGLHELLPQTVVAA